jgi:hypothetical protein
MITLFTENSNTLLQKNYDALIAATDLLLLPCAACGHCGCLIGHGSYVRAVKLRNSKRRLKVRRAMCKECGTTHALLPSLLVPYSQIPLKTQADIIRCAEGGLGFVGLLGANLSLDESDARAVARRYRLFWKERLASEGIPASPLGGLVRRCFARFGRQFMQIRPTKNNLFPRPT